MRNNKFMKIFGNKGSALVQVLVLGTLIATIVVVLLRFSVTRTANMSQTKNLIGSSMAMKSCLNLLNDEDTRRIELGKKPYLTENTTYYCSVPGYDIAITEVATTAISHQLNFTIKAVK